MKVNLKNLETRVNDSVRNSQIKGARQLEDLKNAVDFIIKKFKDYDVETRKEDEHIKHLVGQISALHNKLRNLETKLDQKEHYLRRNCLLVHVISDNKDKDTDVLVLI